MKFRPDPKPISSKEFKKKYGKRNKYNAVRQTYNGYSYDSKREAQEAYKLDLLIKAGEIKKWERQHKIPIVVNGKTVANYYVDFKIWHIDGRIEYREVKGARTAVFNLKWKLVKALYPEWDFTIVK